MSNTGALIEAMQSLRAAWDNLMDIVTDIEASEAEINNYITEKYPFDRSLDEVDVASWCISTIEAVKKEREAKKVSAKKEAKALIADLYARAREWDKPDTYKLGGTYYGGTQLFAMVGNDLELIDGGQHTSYDYGGRTNYKDVYAIRIGGAYVAGKELGELSDKLVLLMRQGGDFAVIDDHGTNFSVVGIGQVVH